MAGEVNNDMNFKQEEFDVGASVRQILSALQGDAARLLAHPDRLNVVAVGLLEKDEDKRLAEVVRGWQGLR